MLYPILHCRILLHCVELPFGTISLSMCSPISCSLFSSLLMYTYTVSGFRVTRFLDFVHRLELWITVKHNVYEIVSISVFGRGRLIPILLGPIESANLSHWILPSSAEKNRYSFRNGETSRYFEFRTMKEVLKPCNSEYYSQLPEPFIFYSLCTSNLTAITVCMLE